MVHSTTALTLFTAAAFLSTGVSAHLPGRDGLAARHAHVAPHKKAASAVAEAARSLIPDLEKIRRSADDILARTTGSSSQKTKRRVKKRKNQCVPQVGFNATRPSASASFSSSSWSSSAASSSASSSAWSETASATQTDSQSKIGNEHIATGSATSTAWSSASSAAETSASSGGGQQYNSLWNLEETWSGSSFFDHWDFWNHNDPTHGVVDYVDAGTAWNTGLVSINDKGNAIMKVDTTQYVSGNRRSVRLHGKLVFTGGLVLMDAVHMPVGCATWPAWWQNGPNWPIGGEIDILEGVNNFKINQVSIHTDNGCTMPDNQKHSGYLTTGNFDNRNCASYATSNQGCGVRDTDQTAYGDGFNNVGGGVYAMKWDKSGINVWWFQRGQIPADITAEQPMPDQWGLPMANFPSSQCDPYKYFYDNINIFTSTLCGDWAGGIWNYADAGETETCAQKTGYSSCEDYVRNSGDKFQNAYWEVAYVKYFNSTSEV